MAVSVRESDCRGLETLVRVNLLGPFAIALGERRAGPWPRPSAKRLCALVFLSRGRRIAREVACETLFGDLGPKAAAHALYNALSAARTVLADLGGAAANMLGSDRAFIYISSSALVEVDLDRHEGALRAALAMAPGTDRDAALAHALSEQGLLLEDEPYADWALRPREALDLVRQEARVALARDRSRGAGRSRPEPVIEAWEACLAHEPASEEAAAALMGMYAAQGQRHLVVRAYQRCCAGLEDLGLQASSALEELYATTTSEAADFAAGRSLDAAGVATNLPGTLSTFVGRELEQAEVRSLVGSSRLVSVVGAGGSGKTRLALVVAAGLLDGTKEGVFFVDLAPVAAANQVPSALGAALGAREQAGRPLLELLLEVISGQDLLIVMDNCEHVIAAAADLAERLERSCPNLNLLVTSREPLGVEGERVYRLRPLCLPAEEAVSLEDIEGTDAVALFVERARDHDSSFALDGSTATLAASICRRLDGIPLAIELAAARLSSMSLAHLNERLDQRFRLLTDGARTAVPRQRTLRATVDWSFDLLGGLEQAVLIRLSVFAGGFELEAAEAVCATGSLAPVEVLGPLGSLVNKSLVVAERSSGSLRYRLLDTIRQYAADRLVELGDEAGARRARRAHAEFYLQLAERAAPELNGARQSQWGKRLDLEWDNIRAALAHLHAEPDRTEDVLRLGVALWRFFVCRDHLDALATVRSALARGGAMPAALRARALCYIGCALAKLDVTVGAGSRPEMRAGRELMRQGLEVARDLDDRALVAEVLGDLCWMSDYMGEPAQAAQFGEEALQVARSVGDPRLIGAALGPLALVAPTPDEKRALWLESLACLRRAGDVHLSIFQLWPLAVLEIDAGRLEAAREFYQEAIAASEEVGSPGALSTSWGGLGWVLLLQGEFAEAELWCRKALGGCRRLGYRSEAVVTMFKLACCATGRGNYDQAAQLTGAHDAMHAVYVGDDVIPEGAYKFNKWAPLEQKVRDENRARLREVLGEAGFERAYNVGKGLTFDEAADLALGKVRARDPAPGKVISLTGSSERRG